MDKASGFPTAALVEANPQPALTDCSYGVARPDGRA